MLSTFTIRFRSVIWFLIFTFTLSTMPHLEMLIPYRIHFFSSEAYAAEDPPETAPAEPPAGIPAEPPPETSEKEASPEDSSASGSGAATLSTGETIDQIAPAVSFKVDDFSGAAHLSYPIAVPPAREGLAPQVSLIYSSSGGNGLLGVGWSLTEGFIQRRGPRKGVPKYNDNLDVFELQLPGGGPQELMKVQGGIYNGQYRLKIEGALLKIEYVSSGNYWKVTDKSGLVMKFGQSDASRIVREAPYGSGTYRWCISEVEDLRGNYIQFFYQKPTGNPGQIYLQEIRYNGNKVSGFSHNQSIRFILETGNRPDPICTITGEGLSL